MRITTLLLGLALCLPSFAQVPNTNPDNQSATAPEHNEQSACTASPNPKKPLPLAESPYWVFIGFLYACIAADIAGRFAKVSYRWSTYEQFLREHWWIPVYSHLILASFVLGTSWMAWSRAFAIGEVTSPDKVISAEALLVIVDFAILVMYFSLVVVVGNERKSKSEHPELSRPARKHSSYWIAWILSAYVVWDFFAYFLIPRSQCSVSCFWTRSWMSMLCAALGWLAFLWLNPVRSDRPGWMLAGDASMLALILFYRALKQVTQAQDPAPLWLIVFSWVTLSVFMVLSVLTGTYGEEPPPCAEDMAKVQ